MTKAINYNSDLISSILSEIPASIQEKTDKRMKLAARIHDAMKAKGWKKTDFASSMNKRPSEITKWLSGTHNFESDTLFDIERVLDIKLINLNVVPEIQVINYNILISSKAKTKPYQPYIWLPASGYPNEKNQIFAEHFVSEPQSNYHLI